MHAPSFACPLCRTFANLEDDVEVEVVEQPGIALLVDTTPVIVTPNTPAVGGDDNLRTAAPDPGAETEVENDNPNSGPRSGARRRSFVPPIPAHAAPTDVDDAEMVDLSGLPALPEHEDHHSDDGDSLDGMFPPMAALSERGGGATSAAGNRSAECLSEAGSGVGMQVDEGGVGEAGSSEGSGRGSAELINGKRKR